METNRDDIHLTEEQKEALAAVAQQAGRPWAEVFFEALRSYQVHEERASVEGGGESAYEALKRAGLVGCIQGGPPDLSTNPEYMEGFGESDK